MARTFWLTLSRCTDTEHLQLQDGGDAPQAAPAISVTFPGTGWTVGTTAPTKYARMDSRTERAAANFGASAEPSSGPDSSIGDCHRSILPLAGSFAATAWTISVSVKADTSGGTQDGRVRVRVWKSTSISGSGATEITSGAAVGTTVTNLSTTVAQQSVATFSPGVVTLADQYLFIQIAWEITGAGSSATDDVLLQLGANSSVVTPAFTPTHPLQAIPIFEVDWRDTGFARTGHVTDAFIDCTRHLREISWGRGRDDASHLKGRSNAGTLHASLDNRSGIYSTFDTGSVLAGYVTENHRVRVRTTYPVDKTHWGGTATEFHALAGRPPTCEIPAVGLLSELVSATIDPAPVQQARTGALMTIVLDEAGIAAADYDVATGDVTAGYWLEQHVSALDAARRIEDDELGWIGEDNQGRIFFQNRNYRIDHTRSNTVQATYSDTGGATLQYGGIDEGNPLREIFDRVVITVVGIDISTEAGFVWGVSPGRFGIFVPHADSLTIVATYYGFLKPIPKGANIGRGTGPITTEDAAVGDFVSSWITPNFTTDLLLKVDPNLATASDLSVTVNRATGLEFEFTITNSNPTLDAQFTAFGVRGYLATAAQPLKVVVGEGVREYPYPGTHYGDLASAQDAANRVYTSQRYPRSNLVVSGIANRSVAELTDALTRDLSDRIHATATGSRTKLGIDDDYYIEAMRHAIGRNRIWQYEFTCLAVNPTQLSGPTFGVSPDDIAVFGVSTFGNCVFG
jgi:hypothetical protein